ncbi:hypothetical protein RV134_310161 [Roseovarius sp. EC-HK134]|nr:hypothetical protein RV134_310161 [Roseovarius sp. EC-HK134]
MGRHLSAFLFCAQFITKSLTHKSQANSRRALPISLPVPANRRVHRVRHKAVRQFAIVRAAVIFQPCGMVRILVKVLRAYVVVRLIHNTANLMQAHHRAPFAALQFGHKVMQALARLGRDWAQAKRANGPFRQFNLILSQPAGKRMACARQKARGV